MTTRQIQFAVAGLLACLFSIPILVALPAPWLVAIGGALGLAGTITVNYLDPGSGTTAPTGVLAAAVNAQTLQLGMGDADTTQVVTHMWGLGAAQLAKGFPTIQYW